MEAVIFATLTFVSTLLGGLTSLRFKNKIHLILGFTAGVVFGLVAFDILPEIFGLTAATGVNPKVPMIALVAGFMIFHIVEKLLLVHRGQEENYPTHHHPTTGVYSALALAAHSFFDGVGIGLGFQVSVPIGVLVSVAVIGHDFSDGLNTGAIMLLHKHESKNALKMILVDAIAPVLGVLSTLFFHLPEKSLVIYLGFFAGFLLYIGLEDILPEAHRKNSAVPIIMTLIGLVFIFFVTSLI